MDKKAMLMQFVLGFFIYMGIIFLFNYYGGKKPLLESTKIAAAQSVLLNIVITLLAMISPRKIFKKK